MVVSTGLITGDQSRAAAAVGIQGKVEWLLIRKHCECTWPVTIDC